eukprot:jgi/Ulvmu1/3899/UM018_0121.1
MQACTIAYREGQGRCLEATRDLNPGELIVSEAPILMWIAHEAVNAFCAQCFKTLPQPGHLCCGETHQACFCSHSCQVHAEHVEGSASLALRRRLLKVPWDSLSPTDRDYVRFLIHAFAIRDAAQHNHGAARKWERLLGLQAVPQTLLPDLCSVWKVINQVCGPNIPHEDVCYLVGREMCNSFGIMAPSHEEGERRIRGSALYQHASCLNHECIPNAARVEDFDDGSTSSTYMRVRPLHKIPAGEQICISYFSLALDLTDRRRLCRDQYNFNCTCMRCMNEERQAAVEAMNAPGDPSAMPQQLAELRLETQYVELFLMKYICPDSACSGTMAPAAAADGSTLHCNICGFRRTDAQFLAEVEALMHAEGAASAGQDTTMAT